MISLKFKMASLLTWRDSSISLSVDKSEVAFQLRVFHTHVYTLKALNLSNYKLYTSSDYPANKYKLNQIKNSYILLNVLFKRQFFSMSRIFDKKRSKPKIFLAYY